MLRRLGCTVMTMRGVLRDASLVAPYDDATPFGQWLSNQSTMARCGDDTWTVEVPCSVHL